VVGGVAVGLGVGVAVGFGGEVAVAVGFGDGVGEACSGVDVGEMFAAILSKIRSLRDNPTTIMTTARRPTMILPKVDFTSVSVISSASPAISRVAAFIMSDRGQLCIQ